MTFRYSPARIIWGIVIKPEEKTTAFGGVATGSMNAQLAASVTGTDKISGESPSSRASAPRIGKNVAVVARLLVISVRNITRAVAQNTTKPMPRTDSGDKPSASHDAKPLLDIAEAKLKPPPNSMRTPQGNCFKSSQHSSLLCSLDPLGVAKSSRAPVNAIEASDRPVIPKVFAKGRRIIQNKITNPKINATLFSEDEARPSATYSWFRCVLTLLDSLTFEGYTIMVRTAQDIKSIIIERGTPRINQSRKLIEI